MPAADVGPLDRESSTAPTAFGNYELKRKLGVGGMAETVVAVRRGPGGFEQEVCLKRILPAFALDERFVDMFLSEARLAARLRHNNVVQVYDFGEDDGVYYLALELVDGLDFRGILSEMKRRGDRLPVELLVYLIYELLAALSYAHNLHINGAPAGLVHRDVTPSNVLISLHGEVKLTDFGIAKATRTNQATQTGSIKGKIPYMSPEQAQGERVDQRTDLFAVGVIVYEALAGHRPFDGPTDTSTLLNIARGTYRPIHEVVPDVPMELRAFVEGTLQRQPDDRIQTARDAADLIVNLVPPPFVRREVSELVHALRGQQSGSATAATHVAGDPLDVAGAGAKATTTSGVRPSDDPPEERGSGTLLGSGPEQPLHALEPTEVAPGVTETKVAAETRGSASSQPGDEQPLPTATRARETPAPVDALAPPFQVSRTTRLAAFVLGMMLVASGLTFAAVMTGSENQADAETDSVGLQSPPQSDIPEVEAKMPAAEKNLMAPATVSTPEPTTVSVAPEDAADPDTMDETAPTGSSQPQHEGQSDATASRPVPVKVSVSPHGDVWIDGQHRGSNSVTVRLPPGRHRFQAGYSYPLTTQYRRVRPGRRMEVRLTIPKR